MTIYEGEFISIMGTSGSGKSTLLNILGCLDRPTSGEYFLDGIDLSTLKPHELATFRGHIFGFVFQRYHLINGLNAIENVEIPGIYAGLDKSNRHLRATEILNSLNMNDKLYYKPSQLSGGQQQRVSIARALMNGGRIILADEPTGALDTKNGSEVLSLLHELHQKGHTIILITHDPQIAQQANRIIHISDGNILENETELSQNNRNINRQDISLNKEKHGSVDWIESIRMAFRSLQINIFRAILTMLGIIIGVASVVTMLAIGNGAKKVVLERIKAIGTRLLVIRPGAPGLRGGGSDVITLVTEDAEAILRVPGVDMTIPEMSQPVIARYRNKDFATFATGTTMDFPMVRNWQVEKGAFFTKKDMDTYSQVAIIGGTLIENLFENEDPIGKNILLGNVLFKIIGIMETKGSDAGGNDQDNMLWIPLSTGRVRLFGQRHLRSISIQVSDSHSMDTVLETVRQLLIKRHKKEDFKIRSLASIIQMVSETQNTLTYLLGSIAIISLIVGGIGVMNIMLVTVRERTREIGIRIAVGARAYDVLYQFITEAIVVCIIGGLIGIALGYSAGLIVSNTMGWLALFSMDTIILAFCCSVVTGLIFGYLPAKKAATLDPVVALNVE